MESDPHNDVRDSQMVTHNELRVLNEGGEGEGGGEEGEKH